MNIINHDIEPLLSSNNIVSSSNNNNNCINNEILQENACNSSTMIGLFFELLDAR